MNSWDFTNLTVKHGAKKPDECMDSENFWWSKKMEQQEW
jgi:hypothetical protein